LIVEAFERYATGAYTLAALSKELANRGLAPVERSRMVPA
jgi:hypothetical protein